MINLKTLNDFEAEYKECKKGDDEEWYVPECQDHRTPHFQCKDNLVLYEELRQEAIKWVKEDKERIDRNPDNYKIICHAMLIRWMKRLNIKEEDLE